MTSISRAATLADLYLPGKTGSKLLYNGITIIGASALISLCAQLSIIISVSPVPVTLQTLAVLLIGAALGPRRGVAAVIVYLTEGCVGLPVFSHASSGVAHLFGPTGGYLAGFLAMAYVTGTLAQRQWDRNFFFNAGAMLAGNAVLYIVALPWLALFTGAGRVLAAGLYPFICGDLVKLIVASLLLPSAWKIIGAGKQ